MPPDIIGHIMYSKEPISQTKRLKTIQKIKNKDLFHQVASLTLRRRSLLNVLLAMSRKVNSMFMSQSWLAQQAGFECRQNANEAIQLFKELKWIFSKRRRYYYGWRTNTYSMSYDFFKPSIARELYTLLPALRDAGLSWQSELSKKTTQLKDVEYISLFTDRESCMEPTQKATNQTKHPPNFQDPFPSKEKLLEAQAPRDIDRPVATLADVFANLGLKLG